MSENKNFALVDGEEREKIRSLVRGHSGALTHLKENCHTILFKDENKVYFVIDMAANELGILRVENPFFSEESQWNGNIACGLIAIFEVLDFFEESITEIRLLSEVEKKHLADFMRRVLALLQSVEDQVFDLLMNEIEEASKRLTQKPMQGNPSDKKTRWDLLN